jgi:hypothetical protein
MFQLRGITKVNGNQLRIAIGNNTKAQVRRKEKLKKAAWSTAFPKSLQSSMKN